MIKLIIDVGEPEELVHVTSPVIPGENDDLEFFSKISEERVIYAVTTVRHVYNEDGVFTHAFVFVDEQK